MFPFQYVSSKVRADTKEENRFLVGKIQVLMHVPLRYQEGLALQEFKVLPIGVGGVDLRIGVGHDTDGHLASHHIDDLVAVVILQFGITTGIKPDMAYLGVVRAKDNGNVHMLLAAMYQMLPLVRRDFDKF
jgi:hypothetical protein